MNITRTTRIWEIAADREPGDEWENVDIGSKARPFMVCPDRIRLSWTSYDGKPAGLRAWIIGPRVLKSGSHSGQHNVEVTYQAQPWISALAAEHMPEALRQSGRK